MSERDWISKNGITPSSCDVYQGELDYDVVEGVQLIRRNYISGDVICKVFYKDCNTNIIVCMWK